MNTQILGLHHVTAMTSSAEKIYHFFTENSRSTFN